MNQRIFIFGGVLAKDGAATNELLWMTTERMEWHSQPTRGDKPCPRWVAGGGAGSACSKAAAIPLCPACSVRKPCTRGKYT